MSGGGVGFDGAGRATEPCEGCAGGVERGGGADDEPLSLGMITPCAFRRRYYLKSYFPPILLCGCLRI